MTSKLLRWQRPPGAPPLVLGHRGARHAAPENTFAAFDLALAEGADGVEIDVRLDGSGELIVLHDLDLGRVTEGRDQRCIERLNQAERERVRLPEGQRIPRLEEVLTWAVRHDTRVNVELKHDVRSHRQMLRRLAELLGRMNDPARHVLISSFNPILAFRFLLTSPGVATGWLVHAGQELVRDAPLFRKVGFDAVHPEWRLLTAERARRWKQQGGLINVWTVNEPQDAKTLSALGVDAIITDVPGRVRRAVA